MNNNNNNPSNDIKVDDPVNHPYHYTWLKELCGIEPIEITRYLDFNKGNAIKYILRAGRKIADNSHTKGEIQDLKKAIFYLNDEIEMIKRYSNEVQQSKGNRS